MTSIPNPRALSDPGDHRMKWLEHVSRTELRAGSRTVALVLAMLTGEAQGVVSASIALLEQLCVLKQRAVEMALKELADRGLVRRLRRRRSDDGRVHELELVVPGASADAHGGAPAHADALSPRAEGRGKGGGGPFTHHLHENPPPPTPPARANAAASHARSDAAHGEQPASGKNSTERPAFDQSDPSDRQKYELLRDAKVFASNACKLAAVHTREEIEWAIKHATSKPKLRDRSGFIAACLTSGEAQEGLRQQAEGDRALKKKWYMAIMNQAQHLSSGTARDRHRWTSIVAVWPNSEALLAADPLPMATLKGLQSNVDRLIELLVEHATRQLRRHDGRPDQGGSWGIGGSNL